MRIHHLNCISSCPLGGSLMDGRSMSLRARLSCHCLLIETHERLVLVDTGFGLQDVAHPRPRLSRFFLTLMAPELRAELTAIRQIERVGFDPKDVRDIVLTHLDFDHAGGLDDFPWARVHLLTNEWRSALSQRTILDRMRYRPLQWSTQPHWQGYQAGEGESWHGFASVRPLEGLDELALVPLVGHTLGHSGVAIDCDGHWSLHCGDAYFWREEMRWDRPYCTPGLRLYQVMMEKNRKARLWNQGRLRQLKREHPEITVFCAHDPIEFEQMAGRPLDVPVTAGVATPERPAAGEGTPVGGV